MNRQVIYSAVMLFFQATVLLAEDGPWQNLIKSFDASSQTVAGTWRLADGELTTGATGGSRITLPFEPTSEYEFRVSFTRRTGVHSVALIFADGPGQATFEVDAWGQHLAGLQMIGGRGIRDNATRTENQTLENGRRYTMRVEVRRDKVRAFLDDKLIAEHATDGADLSTHGIWQIPNPSSLGLGAHDSETTFHSVEVRLIGDARLMAANSATTGQPGVPSRRNPAGSNGTSPSASPSTASESGTGPNSDQPAMRRSAVRGKTGKRVLLVIANQDFFYREYNDPRQELERAGIAVDVAAGTKTVCRPHRNSGEQGSGEVVPDLAITEAKADNYDAIMFSGGWGSSMYQYSFQGRYGNQSYNGDPRIKQAVNKLLTDFMRQDKIVGALCHGVSVLAWARVDGRSILDGRKAVGSPRQSPGGSYPGLRDVPLSRWNAEVNGARLTPVRSIGDPRTSEDDVMVDGKIITGEDDNSARLFGRTLANLVNRD